MYVVRIERPDSSMSVTGGVYLQLEEEVEKVRSAHEELVGACDRRERLERAARVRLQADTRRLHDLNRALKHQVPPNNTIIPLT